MISARPAIITKIRCRYDSTMVCYSYDTVISFALRTLKVLFSRGIAEVLAQSAFYKDMVVKIEDKISKYRHIIVIKVLEQRTPLSPAVADLRLEREWKRVSNVLAPTEQSESDMTIIIVGRYTSGVMRKSYIYRKLSGRTIMVYYLQARYRSIEEILRKIIGLITNFYRKTVLGIKAKLQRLEEQGLNTANTRIAQIQSFLVAILRLLETQLTDSLT